MLTNDPPAACGTEQLFSIHVPTKAGMLYVTHVGDPQLDTNHPKGLLRPIAATNIKADAGAWPKAVAEEYLVETKKMWIMATMGRAR